MKHNGKIKIEKNVPIPRLRKQPKNETRGSKPLYPWHQMVVGDSFFVPEKSVTTLKSGSKHFSDRHPAFRFTSKAVNGGVRVWRIE